MDEELNDDQPISPFRQIISSYSTGDKKEYYILNEINSNERTKLFSGIEISSYDEIGKTSGRLEKKITKANDPVSIRFINKEFLEKHTASDADKYMAWCDDENTRQLSQETFQHQDVILLIGPEGDFSPAEIELARANGYQEVKLGNRRLRTETAGLYGCLLMAAKNLT